MQALFCTGIAFLPRSMLLVTNKPLAFERDDVGDGRVYVPSPRSMRPISLVTVGLSVVLRKQRSIFGKFFFMSKNERLVLNLSFFSTCIALKQSIRTSTRTILKGTPASEIRTAVITIRYRRGGRRSNSSPNDSRRLVHFRVCKHDGAYLLNFHIPFLASKRMPTTACS